MVSTVMFPPAQVWAGVQVRLRPFALHVVQENPPGPIAKVRVSVCRDGTTTAQLLAHHHGILHAPLIIAHRPPISLEVDLHTALAGVKPLHQTDGAVS